jgi:hypothetical protein
MIGFHSSSAQPLVYSPHFDRVDWQMFNNCRDEALLTYQRLGSLLHPWDESWRKKIEETRARLYERTNEIGDTGLTDRGIVEMIKRFEQIKVQRAQNESGGSADT